MKIVSEDVIDFVGEEKIDTEPYASSNRRGKQTALPSPLKAGF